jgi:hypothetical protein
MRLAEHREVIEAKSATVADLTVNAAARLLKPKKRKTETKVKPAKKPATVELNSLSWSGAPAPARARFVSGVGLQALYEAAAADEREQFKVWFQQQSQPPAVEPSPTIALDIPADLNIPEFLRRDPLCSDRVEPTDNVSVAALNVLKPPHVRLSLNTHRRLKLGDEVVDGLKGTTLDSARELDALIYLNRGTRLGEILPEVQQLIDAAKSGKVVSAHGIITPKRADRLRRDLPQEATA